MNLPKAMLSPDDIKAIIQRQIKVLKESSPAFLEEIYRPKIEEVDPDDKPDFYNFDKSSYLLSKCFLEKQSLVIEN